MIVVESMNVHAEKSTTTLAAQLPLCERTRDRVVLTDVEFADQRHHRHIALGAGFTRLPGGAPGSNP